MLMDILMEALMSMDDESLDYVLESCNDEELEIISDAMEASTEMTAKDKEDFDFINKVQRQASSKGGWASVDKQDRDKFVDIMSKTKNLKVLKKAKKLGEREANNDTKVQRALTMIGSSVAGGTAGALMGYRADAKKINELEDNAYNKLRNYADAKVNSDLAYDWYKYCDDRSNNCTGDIFERSDLSSKAMDANHKFLNKFSNMVEAKRALTDANMKLNEYGHPVTLGGGVVGSIAGAGIGAAINAAKKGIKNARDLKALKAQGDTMHPDKQWKLNRKNNK